MLTQRPCCGRARPAVSRCPRPPRALAATPDRPQLAVPALAGSAAAGALDPAVLQTLREKVERDEAALTCSRAALRAADRLSHSAATDDMNYGFTRQRLGQYNEAGAGVAPPTPRNALALAGYTFQTEFRAVVAWARAGFKDDGGPLVVGTPAAAAAGGASAAEPTLAAFHRSQLGKLTLSNAGIAAREAARPSVPAPPSIKLPYLALCWALDTLFDGRPLPRLWLLEHVARMPYLAYASMIHLYESLGWWRMGAAIKARTLLSVLLCPLTDLRHDDPPLQRIHFAQEWNEFHHLLVMESLGGDRAWVDRFLAGHGAAARARARARRRGADACPLQRLSCITGSLC